MPAPKRRVSIIKLAALLLLAGLVAFALIAQMKAASLISSAATKKLCLPVKVSIVDFSVRTGITLYGLTVENPPGYESPYLLKADAVTVLPDYAELVRGRLVVDRVWINGPAAFVEKDAQGRLNAAASYELYREKNPPGKPLPYFLVRRLFLKDGKVNLAGMPGIKGPVEITEFTLDGLTSEAGKTAGFDFRVALAGGPDVSGEGSVDAFSKPPSLEARAALHTENIADYLMTPKQVVLDDAVADLVVGAALRDNMLDASASASISGVKTSVNPDEVYSAGLAAHAVYDIKADKVSIDGTKLAVAGLPAVEVSGVIKDVRKEAFCDIAIVTDKIELAELARYMPEGLKVSGEARLDDVYVKGPLKPFGAESGGKLEISGLNAEFKGKKITGAYGGTKVAYAKGNLSGTYDFRLLGGVITGGFGYGRDGSSFRLSAVKLDASKLEGLPAGTSGMLDADIEGRVEPGLASARADVRASVKGVKYALAGKQKTRHASNDKQNGVDDVPTQSLLSISGGEFNADIRLKLKGKPKSTAIKYSARLNGTTVEGKGLTIGEVKAEGSAAIKDKALSADGVADLASIGYKGRNGALSARYAWKDGRLRLSEAEYADNDTSIKVGTLTALYEKGRIEAKMAGGRAGYREGFANVSGISAKLTAGIKDGKPETADATIQIAIASVRGLPVKGVSLSASLKDGRAAARVSADVVGNPLKAETSATYISSEGLKKPALSGNLYVRNLASLQPAIERPGGKVALSGGSLEIEFDAAGETLDGLAGSALVKLDGLEADLSGGRRLTGISTELRPAFTAKTFTLPESGITVGDSFTLNVSAEARKAADGWEASGLAVLPETEALSLQEGVLEALPPTLMWADVGGKASARVEFSSGVGGVSRAVGAVELDGVTLDIPDKKVSIGPVDGRVPVDFSIGGKLPLPPPPYRGEVFDREHYPALVRSYSTLPPDADVVIEKVRYGFVEFDAVAADLSPGPGYYDIGWFGLSTFGGRVSGYGRADLSRQSSHTLSLIVSDISMTAICDTVPAIKGYLSGRVDGLIRLVASGGKLKDIAGAAIFWAKEGPGDDTEISKEFIKKLMGPSMKKYMFIGDRNFDKGELEVVFLDGDLVFEQLLIENTNFFGQRDLYITVAPVSNRISIEHLLEVIREVSVRAKR